MPSTPSHPSSAERPVVPGHPRANTPAPADPARLPEGKTVLFYPSCGFDILPRLKAGDSYGAIR
jgi:hypothetical protein